MLPVLLLANLRLLVGLVAFGYSVLKADFREGGGVSNEILKSIVGHTTGAVSYEFLKGGAQSALEQFAKSLQGGDSENLNHDLQRAARKAELTATLLAVHACLADTKRLKAQERSLWLKASGLLWHDDDERRLKALAERLHCKLDNPLNDFSQPGLEPADIIALFDTRKDLSTVDTPKQIVEIMKRDILDEVEAELKIESRGTPFPQHAFESVSEAILN